MSQAIIGAIEAGIVELQKSLDDTIADTSISTVDRATKLSRIGKKLAGLLKEKAALEKTATNKKIEASSPDEEEIQQAKEVIGEEIRSLIIQHDIQYIGQDARWALCYEELLEVAHEFGKVRQNTLKWVFLNDQALGRMFPIINCSDESFSIFITTIRELGRMKADTTYGVNVVTSSANLLKLKPATLVEGTPHWFFDVLIQSICGGKEENITHLEQCLVHKWRDPACPTIPWVVFNDGGGTGKSLYATTVLSQLHGSWACRPNLGIEHLVGDFNELSGGVVTALINEKPEDNYDHNRLKAVAHSPSFTINPKGRKAYEAQNLMWANMASNNSGGTVKLANNDSDRRFSIIAGTEPLEFYVAGRMECSLDEAKNWIIQHGQWILREGEEFGKWLNSLVARHGKVYVNKALHGEDYRALIGIQKPLKVSVWEKIFLDEGFDHIRANTLWEYYTANCKFSGQIAGGRNNFYKELREWLKKNGLAIEERDVVWIHNGGKKTSKVFCPIAGQSTLLSNDDEYFSEDQYQRKTWEIDFV